MNVLQKFYKSSQNITSFTEIKKYISQWHLPAQS